MSDEPSPRPWRTKRSPIGSNTWIVSGEVFVATVSSPADAALIVAAVNERAKFEEARMEFPDLRPVIIATGNAAVMRAALVEILDRTNREKARDYDAALNGGILEIHDIANTALNQTKGE